MREADIFKALADKTRVCIVKELLRKKMCINDLVKCIGTSQPNISQHIRVLEKAGIIEVSRKGRLCCCKIRNPEKLHLLLSITKEIRGE